MTSASTVASSISLPRLRAAIHDGYWRSYLPPFLHRPGYVYAYALGNLLALAIYARYGTEGASFVPSYLELLAAGGSDSPNELAKLVGVDLTDPEFWNAGLTVIEHQLVEAEALAGVAVPSQG